MYCIEEKGSNSIGINPGESHLFDILYTGESLIDHRKVLNFLFKLYNQIVEYIYIYILPKESRKNREKENPTQPQEGQTFRRKSLTWYLTSPLPFKVLLGDLKKLLPPPLLPLFSWALVQVWLIFSILF